MRNFILKGNICYSVLLKELKTIFGYVVCENGISRGVFEEIPEKYKDFEIIDFSDKLIIPGMVDLHIHAAQYVFRGMGMDYELIEWLNFRTYPEEAKYEDVEYAKKAYSIFAENMRKSVTTRACIFATIHREATKILMDLMENTGLVTYVGKVNMDRFAPQNLIEETADISAFNTCVWLKDLENKYKFTRPILTPRFIPSCTDVLMEQLGKIQKAYNLSVQSHLSENHAEIELVKELCPDSKFYGNVYDKYGLFGKEVNTVMAHCIWSTDDEVRKIKENGVFIAHCPASNMNLSSGIAPIRKYLDEGIKVGLGSDVAGGQSESMFRAITDCIQISKMYWRYVEQNAKPITFEEAFYMATKGGGEFFGKVGSFEEGYEFDAIVLDDSLFISPNKLTIRERIERAIYLSLDLVGVIAKYVGGRKVF